MIEQAIRQPGGKSLIYLYASLGIAMLLPILAGLQMAISVSQLEQGERYFPDLGNVKARWSAKENELQAELIKMPSMPVDPEDACPTAPLGYKAVTNCAYIGEGEDDKSYIPRIYRSENNWSACFISKAPAGTPEQRCADEISAP